MDKRMVAISTLVWGALLALAPSPALPALLGEAPAIVTTSAPSDSIRVGKRVEVIYEIAYPDTLTFHPPSAVREDGTRIVSFKWTERREEHTKKATGKLRFISLDLEGADIPALELVFTTGAGDTLESSTEELHLPVKLVTSEGSELRPLKAQWEAPRSYLFWIVLGVALLLIAGALYALRKSKRGRAVVGEERPALPPDIVALRELAAIERMGLLDRGEFKEYYTQVVDVMRRYIEARFGVEAMDRTTEELVSELADHEISIPGLAEALREADLVKFARLVPGVVPGKRLMEESRRMVAETAPRLQETAATGEVASGSTG